MQVLFNDIYMEELDSVQKLHWNTRLATSDVFHMFTQSIKFFFNSIIVRTSEKHDSSSRQ